MTEGPNISPSAGMSGGASMEPSNNNNNNNSGNGKDAPSSSSSPPPPAPSQSSSQSLSGPNAVAPPTNSITAQGQGLGPGVAQGQGLGPGVAQGNGLGPGAGTWGPRGFTPTSTQQQPTSSYTQNRQQPHTFYASSSSAAAADSHSHSPPKPSPMTRKVFSLGGQQGGQGQSFNMGISTGSASSPFAPVETSYYRR